MTAKRRRRHSPEQIVRKLRDAEAMLNAGQDLSAVLQLLEVSEVTYHRWRNQFGAMKSEEARRLKQLVDEKELDIQMLKHVASKNCRANGPSLNAGPFAEACGDWESKRSLLLREGLGRMATQRVFTRSCGTSS